MKTHATTVLIEPCHDANQPGWLQLRSQLWPDCAAEGHVEDMATVINEPDDFCAFIARDAAGAACGFAEGALRHDYVNGTESCAVVFLEGLYVAPDHRRQGIAARLVDAIAQWGAAHECSEFASDAPLENELSHEVHEALGFEEVERVVYFRREI